MASSSSRQKSTRSDGPGSRETSRTGGRQASYDASAVPPGAARPLAPSLAGEMGDRFGTDFSHVRLHQGAEAQASAEGLNARAYTIGDHVVLGAETPSLSTHEGKRTLAHELAHVVQQRRGGQAPALSADAPHEASADRAASAVMSGGPVSVSGGTGVGVARDEKSPEAPLTPDQMHKIILDQRGHTNRAPQPMPAEGPKAAQEAAAMRGGKQLGDGRDTHSMIQVVGKDGKVVAHELGGHLLSGKDVETAARRDVPRAPGEVGKVHAERMSIAALERRLKGVDVRGGTMHVVVDQIPCGADKKNCMGELHAFAKSKGLKLEIYVSARDDVSPKTAASTAYKGPEQANPSPTGRAELRRIYPPGGGSGSPPSSGGAPPVPPSSSAGKAAPGTAPAAAKPAVPKPAAPAPAARGATTATAPASAPKLATPVAPRLPAPKAPLSAATRLEAFKATSALNAQAREAAQFNVRLQTYLRVYGGLMQLLEAFDTLADAQKMLAEGTVLGDAQRNANQLDSDAGSALAEAEQRAELSQFFLLGMIEQQAYDAEDKETLEQLTEAGSAYARSLDASVETLETAAADLAQRAADIRKVAIKSEAMARTPPTSGGTMPQARAFAMWQSAEKLSNTLKTASDKYADAAANTRNVRDAADRLASMANSDYWAINFAAMAKAVQKASDDEAARRKAAPPPAKAPFRSADISHAPANQPQARGLGNDPGLPGKCPGGCHAPSQPRKADPFKTSPTFLDRERGNDPSTQSEEERLRDWIRKERR